MNDVLYRPIRLQRSSQEGISRVFCEKCDLYVDKSKHMYHCPDCQVCVEGNDHHCMFFSKCIAGGNVISFYAVIAMLVFNFALVGFSSAIYADFSKLNHVGPKPKFVPVAKNISDNQATQLNAGEQADSLHLGSL